MSASKMLSATPVLLSLNIEETILFYTRLGFKCTYKSHEGFAIMQRDDVEIHFTVCTDKTPLDWSSCKIEAKGIGGLYEEYVTQKVIHPEGALKDTIYETREFSIIDVHGVCITFFERI